MSQLHPGCVLYFNCTFMLLSLSPDAVEKLYEGEMTMVGESVAIQGAIKVNDALNPDMEPMEVGYFNMIDGTDDRASYVERAEKLTS